MSDALGPIPDSYWALPGRLIGGEYPRDRSDVSSRKKIDSILGAGVDVFVDLTTPQDRLAPYEAMIEGRAVRQSCQIPDLGVVDPAAMASILDTIDEHLDAGRVVYVHCWGGVGRTGTVIGCALVRHGLTGDEALARIAELRAPTPDGHREAPETPTQREMVRNWSETAQSR